MSTRRPELVAALGRQSQIQVLRTVTNMQLIASRAGINVTDMQCLGLLTLEGSMTPSQIAQTMGISKGGAVTAMIDRLERGGYLRRARDPHDRRKVLVELVVGGTPFQSLAELFRPVEAAFTGVLEGYTEKEIELLIGYLQRNNDSFAALLAAQAEQ